MTDLAQSLSQASHPSISDLPLVSVIIANYNYGHFLNEAIESVLTQTYPHIELLVVDDGSTDHSQQVIRSYGAQLTAIFLPNGGQRTACNAAITQAKGDILCFLDADDRFHSNKVEKVVAGFKAHPEWILISHPWRSMNHEGLITGRSTSNMLSQGDVRPLLLQWGKFASGVSSALSCRRSAVLPLMPVSGKYGIDSFLNASLPFWGQVGCINEPLMDYRIHGDNFRARSTNMPKLMDEHQMIAAAINAAASATGLPNRFDIRRDVDYRAFEAIDRGGIPLQDALEVLWFSLRESLAIRRTPRDTLIRLLNRGLCVLFPQQGLLVMKHGLRGYLRLKMAGQSVQPS